MLTPPRLIASDIDGTLLDNNHRVTLRTRAVISRAVDAGAEFALSTGRPFRWVTPVLEQLPVRPVCVTSNGAVIYDAATDTVLVSHELDTATMAQLAELSQRIFAPLGGVGIGAERCGTSAHDPVEELYEVDDFYAEHDLFQEGFRQVSTATLVSRPAVKILLRSPRLNSKQMFEALNPHLDPALAHLTYSMDEGLIELAAPGVTKAKGVAWLAQHHGIAQADTIAFGDMPNDIEMLQWAGHGVAMGNAAESVKAIAQETTAPNFQAGVAQVLERWF